MKPIAQLAAALLLPIASHAETLLIDFNDVDAPASFLLRDATTDGGTARDGGAFTGGYNGNTGLVKTFAGDLTVSNTGYTASQGAATANGPWHVGFFDTQARARWQHRNIADFATGTTWISFIVNLNPDADADGEGVCFAGIMIGNGFQSGGETNPDLIPGAAYLGLTYIPTQHTAGMTAPETFLEYSPSKIDFTDLTTDQALTLRGTTSANLGLAANTSYLVIAKLDAGADQIDVWIDPADATSEGSLGAPNLTTTLGLPTITCYGMGGFADDDGLANEEHVECKVDAIRISNTPIAYAWITTDVEPLLEIDVASSYNDFNFDPIFTGSGSRSVTFVNNSPNAAETINVEGLSFPSNEDGVYSAGTITYDGGNAGTPPQLLNGDKVTIEIIATSATGGEFLGEALLDTTSSGSLGADVNDFTFNLSSTFYAVGQKLNANPLIDVTINGWGGGAVRVEPGIAAGSVGMMRVKGTGDPDGGVPTSGYQASGVVDGAPNWQMTCFFTPIDVANFASYVDPDGSIGVTGPDSTYADRTFQWVLQSNTTELAGGGEVPNPAFTDTSASRTLVNIAYLPAGADNAQSAGAPDHSGTADFFYFDSSVGSIGAWIPTGIGAIQGSLDNDTDADPLNGFGDGLLDPAADPLDSINVYRMIVTGSGFGSGSSSYDISVAKVSGTDTFTSGSATSLTGFHGVSGTTNTPTGHAFTAGDASSTSNVGDGTDPGFTTPFWVDDACLFAGSAPDPLLTFLATPAALVQAFESPTGTTSLSVRNDGATQPLNIASVVFSDPAFSIPGGIPGVLAPNATVEMEVQFDSTVSGVLVVNQNATVTSDDAFMPVTEFPIAGSVTSYAKLTANGDFEAAGTDNITDQDAFAIWDEILTATNSLDVPGLVAGSTTAAYLSSNGGTANIRQSLPGLANDWTVDVAFAIKSTGARAFNLAIFSDSAGRVNIRYEGTSFDSFNDTTGPGWEPQINLSATPLLASEDNDNNGSLDDVGDVKNVYRLRATGHNWGSETPTWDLELFDEAGTPIASNLGIASFQTGIPSAGLERIEFSNQFGNNPGFWVDEVSASGSLTPPAITLANPVRTGSNLTVDIGSIGNVDVYKSLTLQAGSWSLLTSGTNVAPGSGVLVDGAASETKAFYVAVPTGAGNPYP